MINIRLLEISVDHNHLKKSAFYFFYIVISYGSGIYLMRTFIIPYRIVYSPLL